RWPSGRLPEPEHRAGVIESDRCSLGRASGIRPKRLSRQTWRQEPVAQTKLCELCSLSSQNVSAQVLVLHDLRELLAHVDGVDFDRLLLQIGTVERNILQQFFEDGMEAARPDVLRGFVDFRGEAGYLLKRVFGEGQLDALGIK